MARDRSRSRSFSPRCRSRTPPPRERKRHDNDHRRERRDHRSSGPTGLLVRNLPLNARNEDLRIPFERYGPVKDVYLPKDYHTGKPRGFGFVKFRDASDAAEAKQQLNESMIGGRDIRIEYAEENRKTPQEMRFSCPSGRYGGSHRRRSPPRSPRRRYRSSSRSPSPVSFFNRDRRNRDDDHRSPVHSRSISRSPPNEQRRSVSRSPQHRDHGESPSPRADKRTRAEERVRSPRMSRSPRVLDQASFRFRSRSHSRAR